MEVHYTADTDMQYVRGSRCAADDQQQTSRRRDTVPPEITYVPGYIVFRRTVDITGDAGLLVV